MGALKAVPETAPRAVIYVRQSTAREESVSLELQETSAREHCTRYGYSVARVMTDEGYSGRRWTDRPGVQSSLGVVESGDADVIVVWRWSRLARQRLHFAAAIDRVESLGGRVESATEPVDATTAAGRFQRGMMGEFAAFQSDMIGEQWRETHQRRRNLGLPPAGRPRFGYVWYRRGDPERYEVDADRAETVRWMYQAYLAGWGFPAIAQELNACGIRNAVGREWVGKSVRHYLDSGFAAGLLIRSDHASSTDGHIRHHMWDPAAHEAIIDRRMWDRYTQRRYDRAEQSGWSTRPSHPLTGLTRCGDCDGPMNRGHTRGYYTYMCTRRRQRGGRPCNVMEWRVYEHLFGWLRDLADEVGQHAESAKRAERAQLRIEGDADTARREIADIDRQLANLTRQLVAERVPEEVYDTTRDQLMRDRAEAQQRLDRTQQTTRRSEPAHVTARGLLDEWDTLPVLERRELLSSLIARIVVTPPERPRAGATLHIVPTWDH